MFLTLRACTVDLVRNSVRRPDGNVGLTQKESELLGYLAANAGRPIAREELMEQVWGYRAGVQSRTLDTTVRRLRTKIESDSTEPDHVLTVHGIGYRFELGEVQAGATPSEDLAIAFADIAGKGTLWELDPDGMRVAMTAFDDIVRSSVGRHGGYTAKSDGGSYKLAFPSGGEAVDWAVDLQRALLCHTWPSSLLQCSEAAAVEGPDGNPIWAGPRARIGIHFGPADQTEDPDTGRLDYRGEVVQRALRICRAARGGQVLVSSEVWQERGAAQVEAVALGAHRLAGLLTPIELYQLAVVPYRSHEVIPTLQTQRTNLSRELSSFVGRELDLERVQAALDQGDRLVTLLGTAGAGKTRLARQLGLQLSRDATWPGGVWFVDLSACTSVEDTSRAVATALGLPLGSTLGTQDPVGQVSHVLAMRERTLLILDNYETVARFASEVVESWLVAAGRTQLLVTSRERLGMSGEVVVELAPLTAREATRLFTDRARSARRDFRPPTDGVVSELVERLDRLPLAIELAAARANVLSPAQLLDRIEERFKVLGSTRRQGRFMSLRGALDLSWDLLEPWEQDAFVQCAVFRGGFDLDAAEAVVKLSKHPEVPLVMDAVAALRDKSLLATQEGSPTPRFRMLETLHVYATERLEARPDLEAIEKRHANHFLSRAKYTADPLDYPDPRRLTPDRENVVAILRRALAHGKAHQACDATWVLRHLLAPLGSGKDLADLLDQVVGMAATLPPGQRGDVLYARGEALRMLGRFTRARADFLEARDLAREAQSCELEAAILTSYGNLCWATGDLEGTLKATAEAELVLERIQNVYVRAEVRAMTGLLHWALHDLDAAHALLREALVETRQCGDASNEGYVLGMLGTVHLIAGRRAEAEHYIRTGIETLQLVGNRRYEGIFSGSLAVLCHVEGRWREAEDAALHAIRTLDEVGSRRFAGVFRTHMGVLLADLDRVDEAVAYLGAAQSTFDALHDPVGEWMVDVCRGHVDLALARAAPAEDVSSYEAAAQRRAQTAMDCNRSELARATPLVSWSAWRLASAIQRHRLGLWRSGTSPEELPSEGP